MVKSLVDVWDVVSVRLMLAQIPGQNIQPQAPGEFGAKIERGLNFAFYVGIAIAIVGVIIAGATMVISRREGTSEEATAMALRIGFGAMIMGGATTIISAFL
ncbi:hypothetical protein CMUST_15565 (plasmid) [Corynebacterium mustelae]|uniref:Uncharacterized protein n=1 Tax=Corynebacterium mustelae TaxID=571915 RepID=A0A0G3H8D0_9CORY|nr:hypothetical protein [Corynebacterium mustelae]AKK07402.1 hypothetical protein CMUST_15565 [Corynebacterium mustelae]